MDVFGPERKRRSQEWRAAFDRAGSELRRRERERREAETERHRQRRERVCGR